MSTWTMLAVLMVAWTQHITQHDDNLTRLSDKPVAAHARLIDVWPTSTRPTHRLVVKGVPDFGKLNAYVWRSGQPTREGYQRLAAMGLKTIVNLRAEFPDDKDRI